MMTMWGKWLGKKIGGNLWRGTEDTWKQGAPGENYAKCEDDKQVTVSVCRWNANGSAWVDSIWVRCDGETYTVTHYGPNMVVLSETIVTAPKLEPVLVGA